MARSDSDSLIQGDKAAMPCLQTILIVDGDAAMRETLREQLTRDAFAVIEAATAREAETWLFARKTRFAAAIIEAVLPDGEGHVVCARLRASGMSMPVILMNGSNDAAEHTFSLAKPFRLSELMAHLRAQ